MPENKPLDNMDADISTEQGTQDNFEQKTAENFEQNAELEATSVFVDSEDQGLSQDAQENGGEEQEAPEGSLEEKIMALQAELEQAKAKADNYYAHLQRLQAEFDNYRKRTAKEKEELIKYASEHLVKNLLPVLDNFERATSAAQNTQDVAVYAQGVEMILRQFKDVLSKEGLTPIECVGQPFDPQCHEAVMQVDAEGYPENTVVEELQKGYYLKNKLLRPSMVKVSR